MATVHPGVCPKCKKEKEYNEFLRDWVARDENIPEWCKTCRKEAMEQVKEDVDTHGILNTLRSIRSERIPRHPSFNHIVTTILQTHERSFKEALEGEYKNRRLAFQELELINGR